MGNEESQLGMAAGVSNSAPPPGYLNTTPRTFPPGNFRDPQQNPPTFHSQLNSGLAGTPSFRQVSPFNALPRNPQPQRFSGSNSASRFPAPPSQQPYPGAGSKAPSGMDVDLSGLSEAEKRQIAEVMERANALQGMESAPAVKEPAPHFKAPLLGSNAIKPRIQENFLTRPVLSDVPKKESNLQQTPRVSLQQTFAPSSYLEKPAGLTNHTQNWPLPLALTRDTADSPIQQTRPRPLAEQERALSRSFSSEELLCSLDTPDNSRQALMLPEKWQEDPNTNAHLSVTAPSTSNSLLRQPSTAAQVERCPLCRETELKIVTIHGKPQPLIGQLCARCSLIVCSKCGKVKKSDDQKTAYWLCTQCVDLQWSPPAELDFAIKSGNQADSSSSLAKRQDSYVAPLTQLVTADNTVQSDAVRSSPALFFDEPEYAISTAAVANDLPQYDHHYSDDEAAWDEPAPYPEEHFESTHTSRTQGNSFTLFQPLPESLLPEPESAHEIRPVNPSFEQQYYSTHQASFGEPQKQQTTSTNWEPEEQSSHKQYYNTYDTNAAGFERNEQQGQQEGSSNNWQRENQEPVNQDLFPPQMPTFSSQDSLYEIQEEETSDYGSQIQAACSDIASLSNSTSGGDFSGQRNWQTQSNGANHHWFDSQSLHSMGTDRHVTAGSHESENARGVPLRRSNLVENFRQMPPTQGGVAVTQPLDSGHYGAQQPIHQLNMTHNGRAVSEPMRTFGQPSSIVGSSSKLQIHQPQHIATLPQLPEQQPSLQNSATRKNVGLDLASRSAQISTTGFKVPQVDTSASAEYHRTDGINVDAASFSGTSSAAQKIRRSSTGTSPYTGTSKEQLQGPPTAIVTSGPAPVRDTVRSGLVSTLQQEQPPVLAAYSNNPHNSTQEIHVNTSRSGESERKTHHPDSSVSLRRLIHQGSRDDLLGGGGGGGGAQTGTIEIDDFDSALESATDGNTADFDTVSQCSQLSGTSAATFPQSSSMTGLNNKDGTTQSMERRQKRRLPLLPKDDQGGCSITPEERERQKKELKRRLSGNLLRITQGELPSVDGVPSRPVNGRRTEDGPGEEWSSSTAAGSKTATSKVTKRKKHKHLPQIPQDHDAPKVQQLKQQLRMLAARKAGAGFDDEKSFGSLPNNPLNRFKSISGDEASSTEYLTDSAIRSNPVAGTRNHYASDPALFRSILDQYHRVAQQEKREQELAAGLRQNEEDRHRYQFGGSQSVNLQGHSDPEIQDIVVRLQQFNRDLADTKELFRSTSSSLERRHVPRWKSDADLANFRWSREPEWEHGPIHQHMRPRGGPHFLREHNNQLPFNGRDSQFYQERMTFREQEQFRHGGSEFWHADGDFDKNLNGFDGHFDSLRIHRRRPTQDEFFRLGYDGQPIGRQEYYEDMPGGMPFDHSYNGIPVNQITFPGLDPNTGLRYQEAWMNDNNFITNQAALADPTFLLPLPYLEATQYPGFNPMTDIDNEDLSLYEPFDDPNFLPMGAGVVRQVQQPTAVMNNGNGLQREYPVSSGKTQAQRNVPHGASMFEAPLADSRVSCSDEAGKTVDVGGNDAWEDEKENMSETNSDGLNSTEKVSRSISVKKSRKEDQRPKYNFATKRILLTRDPKDRSVSGNGLGVRIAGGKLIPNTNTLGAFISKIWDNGIMATLDEAKEGDQVLEWNGIPLTNKSYEEVQEILDAGNGEVEMLLRCDYNVRDVEAELDQSRDKQTSLAQAERARLRDMDSGDRSPLPSRSLFSGRKQDQSKMDDSEEIVYRPSNQLVPPSPGGMARKKSTSSGHAPVTGAIQLRMTYERCTLTLQVIKARDLKAADKSGFSDPYCKLNLVPGRASEYKYRTRHIMQTLNPEWKETFTFQSIDPNEIHHKQIEITVWDWDRLSADDFLGEVNVDLTDPVHLDGTKRWYPLGERRAGATDDP